MAEEPIDALDAGVTAVVRAINEATSGIDEAFAAELRAKHGTPEWDLPAPMWSPAINI